MISHGIDMVEIARIEKSMLNEHFVRRVFGENELEELSKKKNCTESAAACFCAKEAFGKSLGIGLSMFSLDEVEVLHDNFGKPYLRLSGKAKELAENQDLAFDLSITHTKEYAMASVIAFKRSKREEPRL